jgi:3,4-dihydroxy-2-butanone 4-phosphate synthase
MTFSSIETALNAVAKGRMIVVVDDEDRENEGDIVMAAQHVTNAHIAFMMREARGLICVPMAPERLELLDIPQMVPRISEALQTAFTVSVDAARGITTGISAEDRATTIQLLIDRYACAKDFARPGHIFPLRANPRGVLARNGHTEAAVDLARLAGCAPAGVICEIAKDDGTMARLPDLIPFARRHKLPLITIADLVDYRKGLGAEDLPDLAQPLADQASDRAPADLWLSAMC